MVRYHLEDDKIKTCQADLQRKYWRNSSGITFVSVALGSRDLNMFPNSSICPGGIDGLGEMSKCFNRSKWSLTIFFSVAPDCESTPDSVSSSSWGSTIVLKLFRKLALPGVMGHRFTFKVRRAGQQGRASPRATSAGVGECRRLDRFRWVS